MATRSAIGLLEDGKVKGIYCHWDGYPEYNGNILLKHYDKEKTLDLLSLGNLSSLNEEIGLKHEFDTLQLSRREREELRAKKWCTFYGRDREESDQECVVFNTVQEFVNYFAKSGAEYFYLLDNKWLVNDGDKWTDLSLYLENIKEEESV